MRMVVSSAKLPDVRVHGEAVDFKAVAPGRVAYCLGLPILSGDVHKARTMMHKLAYQFHDWAAREVVAASRRDRLRRLPEVAGKLRHALAPTPSRVLVHLRENGSARIGDLAADLGIAQPHVSRAVDALTDAGLVRARRMGREVVVDLRRDREAALEALAEAAM